jgi:nucleotide-binding universal stress UspA family protein
MSALASIIRGAVARLTARAARTTSPPVTSSSGNESRARWAPRAVVVGCDGSPAATRAVERAAGVVDGSGVLILVTVESEVYSRGALSEPLLEPADVGSADVLRHARERLRDSDAASVTLLRRGDPADVLVEVARERDADLVVVGRRGRDFTARVLLGSVATRIIANAPCDVLVVS